MINYHKNMYLYGAFIYVFTFDLHNYELGTSFLYHVIVWKGASFTDNKAVA